MDWKTAGRRMARAFHRIIRKEIALLRGETLPFCLLLGMWTEDRVRVQSLGQAPFHLEPQLLIYRHSTIAGNLGV